MAANRVVDIHVVSDVICPWCFIACESLSAAMEKLPDYDIRGNALSQRQSTNSTRSFGLAVHWHPYFLSSRATKSIKLGRLELYRRKFGASNAEKLVQRLASAGQEVGIQFNFQDGYLVNSTKAHTLIKLSEPGFTHELLASTQRNNTHVVHNKVVCPRAF